MMTAITFLISFLIGYLAVTFLFKRTGIPWILASFFSAGVGLGISSILTFYSFLIADGFQPALAVTMHLVILGALVFLFLKCKTNFKTTFDAPRIFSRQNVLGGCCFLGACAVVLFFAYNQPFGQWDAWALWNMKAKFLTTSGHEWRDVFSKLHWHTQPDYPLALPMINIWGWALDQGNFLTAPLVTAVIFTVVCGGLLVSGLERFVRRDIALIAGGFLFFLPWYLSLATSQYADILLAYELLASFVCLVMVLREKQEGACVLLGFFLGLMTFTKNEGIVIALLLSVLSVGYLFSARSTRNFPAFRFAGLLAAGLIGPVSATVIFKIFLAPHNADIALKNMTFTSRFFNYEGIYMIAYSFIREVTHNRWHFLWACVAVLIAVEWRRYFYKEVKILTWFFILYFFIVIAVYLGTVNFDLMWRLSRTLSRILFILLPSILFTVCYVFDYEAKISPKEPGR